MSKQALHDEMRDYLGDGVYVEFDGYSITLSTTRAYEKHFIVLEPEHLDALNRFNAYEHHHQN